MKVHIGMKVDKYFYKESIYGEAYTSYYTKAYGRD
jgi:hypothetical protein